MRVLPADVYDALELSALAYGGIGAGPYTRHNGCPVCAYGHAAAAENMTFLFGGEIAASLRLVDLLAYMSDNAVRSINRRQRRSRDYRVPFAEWCAELNVVRGEA